MVWLAAAWLAGGGLALTGSSLVPIPILALALAGALGASLWDRRSAILVAGLLGALWVTQDAGNALASRLSPALAGRTLGVSGRIADLPRVESGRVRFTLAPDAASDKRGIPIAYPTRIALAWYRPPSRVPRAGERWHFKVHLRRPRSHANPGGFDYAAWALAHGIGATGSVYRDRAELLAPAGHGLTPLRARIAEAIYSTLGANPYAGLVAGLAVGARGGINTSQWQTLRATGTTHLLAISGLHLGLIAAFVFLLVGFAVRRIPPLVRRVPARLLAAGAAALAALAYAALAGFSLPTQRALIMLAVPLAALVLRRRIGVGTVLALAAIIVTLISPLALLTASFWLSFGAVAVIAYGLRTARGGHLLVRTQFTVSLGLVPLIAVYFGMVSLIGPVANLLAIPVVGWTVVSAALTGALATLLHAGWGAPFFHFAAAVLALLWPALEWLGGLPFATLALAPVSGFALAAALVGAACLLAPRGLGLRLAGVALFLPLFWPAVTPRPAAGDFRVTVLDVGQGLATVVVTAHHTLLVDTGPRGWGDNDAGGEEVIPFLHAQRLGRPDLVALSHRDLDHAGGLRSIKRAWPDVPVLSSAADAEHVCRAGEHWMWDGVRFAVLAPAASAAGSRNNRSCVLKVTGAGGSALFPGDIEREGERWLLAHSTLALAADILIAPHHGSKTSSTPAFVRAVHPRFVVFAIGYHNRYHFPNPPVVARYRDANAELLDSAHDGALSFSVTRGNGVRLTRRYRLEYRRAWTDP